MCATRKRSSARSTSRSRSTRASSHSRRRSGTARRRSWRRPSGATRSGWRSSSTRSSCVWSRTSFGRRCPATSVRQLPAVVGELRDPPPRPARVRARGQAPAGRPPAVGHAVARRDGRAVPRRDGRAVRVARARRAARPARAPVAPALVRAAASDLQPTKEGRSRPADTCAARRSRAGPSRTPPLAQGRKGWA